MIGWLANGDGKDLNNGSIRFVGPLVYIYIPFDCIHICIDVFFKIYVCTPLLSEKTSTYSTVFVKYKTKNGTFEEWSLDSKIFREDGFRFQVLSPVKRMFFAVGK